MVPPVEWRKCGYPRRRYQLTKIDRYNGDLLPQQDKFGNLLKLPDDMTIKHWKASICAVSIHALMRFQPWTRWLRQSWPWNMDKHMGVMHYCCSMEAQRRLPVQQTTLTNRKSMGRCCCAGNVEGCQHCIHLQERDRTNCGNYKEISSFHIRQDLRQDPP